MCEQIEESNLTEIDVNRLPQDYLAGIEEKLRSINLSTSKTGTSNSLQDIINNYEHIQSKDNIIYLHQLDRNSFTFLPRDRGPNAVSQTQNENLLRSSDLDACTFRNFKQVPTNSTKDSLNMETSLQTCNSDEISADQKLSHKEICKEIISENKKCDKLLNDDNQLYIELSDLGLLKFDESRYCNSADSVGINPSHAIKSQNFAGVTANDLTYTPVTTQDQDNLTHNGENTENLNNSSNMALNNEEPILRLVQTETGEQFYEFIINDLVEKMQSVSCAKNLEDEAEEPSNVFGHCQSMDPNTRESNEKSQTDRTEHQQTLEDLTDINNEFNYTQFDFHREEKNFAVPCHDESDEHFQSLRDNECANGIQEKNMQTYNSENLELLENESHVDFDKYVETNLEVFERLNYENCSEKFLEFVEVADIGIESSGYNKESSMVCLIQNDGDHLLELLQDSQIIEQEQSQDFVSADNLDNKNCSDALQNNNKIANYPENRSDFFTYVENNVPLEENKNDQEIAKNHKQNTDSDNHSYADLMTNEDASNENFVERSKKLKKPKASSKKFQCVVCKKAFSTAYNYKQHIGIHFTDQQKFHCKDCGASFAWKSTLNKHMANNHSSDGPQKFVCKICPRVYSTLSQVNVGIFMSVSS